MVKPVGAFQDGLHFARFHINCEQGHRQMGCEALLHHLSFADGLIELLGLLWLLGAGSAVVVLAVTFDIRAREQGLVRVDGGDRATRRKLGDLAGGAGIDVGPQRL